MRLKTLVPAIIGLSQFKPFVITTLSFFFLQFYTWFKTNFQSLVSCLLVSDGSVLQRTFGIRYYTV